MRDCHKLTALVKALKHAKGYFVIPVDGEELVVMRKEEFDKLKESKKEVQLELEATPSPKVDIHEHDIDLTSQELAIQQEDYTADYTEHDTDISSDPDIEEQLEVGPRKKVRFEPIKGDISPELQE